MNKPLTNNQRILQSLKKPAELSVPMTAEAVLEQPFIRDYAVKWKRPDGTTGSTVKKNPAQANTTFANLVITLPPGCEVTLEDDGVVVARCVVMMP